jgi:hypothetical protein
VNPPERVPYYAKIEADQIDTTQKLNLDEKIAEAQHTMFKVPGLFSSMTASHAVRLARAILHDTDELLLAPGANGMAGCLPVRVNSRGPRVELPQELSIRKVEAIFREGMKINGIERVDDDGAIVFSESAPQILRNILCINRKVLR